MKTGEAILKRKSIRKFTDKPVARDLIEQVLEAATLAPSGKNKQPWEFVVLEGEAVTKLADLVVAGAEHVEGLGHSSGSAKNSARIIKEAPVTIMVYNPDWKPDEDRTGMQRYMSSVDTQSVGAAIQNMLLKATELGLGSLWICDVFFADCAIGEWLERDDEMVAAVSLGWPGETPSPRPRKSWQAITQWRS